jgi:hypothetical protein
MIPTNTITATPVRAVFAGPIANTYSPTMMSTYGGAAISDPSQGRSSQVWTVTYDGTNILVKPASGITAVSLPVAGVLSVSLAFDTNMAVAIGYQTSAGSHLYYYDTVAAGYATKDVLGATSCRVCVDDLRPENASNSDVIFAYTLGGNLYWTQQRDRYATQRLVGATSKKLIRMGPSIINRLQFQCA